MLISITHRTAYEFGHPVHYALQKLRLIPRDTPQQRVLDWNVSVENGTRQVSYFDHHGNVTELVSAEPDATSLSILVRGRVDTQDTAGVLGDVKEPMPVWFYRLPTPLTQPGAGIERLAEGLRGATETLGALHALSEAIRDQVAYATGATGADTGAEEALQGGRGVCQDHAHIFVSAARAAGIPARYVSGYLFMNDRIEQEATHAWAEAWLEHLGWVGFDISNGYSPDDRYVRIATGADYRDAAPVSGLRQGMGDERLIVSLQIQQ